jgi:hypothetical protein
MTDQWKLPRRGLARHMLQWEGWSKQMLFFIIARLVDDCVAAAAKEVARRRANLLKNSPILGRLAHTDAMRGRAAPLQLRPAGR